MSGEREEPPFILRPLIPEVATLRVFNRLRAADLAVDVSPEALARVRTRPVTPLLGRQQQRLRADDPAFEVSLQEPLAETIDWAVWRIVPAMNGWARTIPMCLRLFRPASGQTFLIPDKSGVVHALKELPGFAESVPNGFYRWDPAAHQWGSGQNRAGAGVPRRPKPRPPVMGAEADLMEE